MSCEKKPTPVVGERNILITSALPYCNNVPHLGTLIGCVLSADVYARYCRMRGYNTLYVCGTDEYGTTTEQKALLEHCTPQEICDKYYTLHKEVYDWFDISFNYFGRTSTEKQTEITQDIFKHLNNNGYIYKESVEQFYCEKCDKFLADRFVEGICPFCNAPGARGDQCDSCQKLINTVELINPQCKVCHSVPVRRSSEHLFIDLPKLQDKLGNWANETMSKYEWPNNCACATKTWLNNLKGRCITRDLKWGTKVPLEGFENKVFYVWFDAPIGYLSITANYTDDWKKWWMDNEHVELTQFLGKDNIVFHSVLFPSTLLGTGQPWTMVRKLATTEYLNYEDCKFSKSNGTGVFGDDAMKTGIPPEVWRYYLLINRPEQSDTVFLWNDLMEKNNNELLKNIGNLAQRTLTFAVKNFDNKIPKKINKITEVELNCEKEIKELYKEYLNAMENVKLKEGLKIAMSISSVGNKYLQDTAAWKTIKSDKERAADEIYYALNILYFVSLVLDPYIPEFGKKVREQMNLPAIPLPNDFGLLLEGETMLGKVEVIFKMISKEQIEELRTKFSGKQGVSCTTTTTKSKAKGNGKQNNVKEVLDGFQLEIRVGKIVEAGPHPNSEHLLALKVDVGEEKPRSVVAGLAEHYKPEELLNQRATFVCNLKPSKLRGVASEAMILAATSLDGTKVKFCHPSADAAIGTQVIPKEGKVTISTKKISIDVVGKMNLSLKEGLVRTNDVPLIVKDTELTVTVDEVVDGTVR
ncbi:methionine-tRNA synthetase, putative [Entamoeba dispar SAW760]|uniref:methionine--tRNA ligase n=1 Tax=Entamoeba dispar (strain ATCC PRA-260 / SAW760) TaxID=370354 RepID=B0EID7_ENTDS|nr:methionine-tRNA synthetase, putative [Entamoeba dispar SAW760]EDR25712.1 methionine-tRNA synthetase, putative [Entamoeba dispar SAW760]|eukprot:EDR25712.1 methionine-tRNA synthetase, putative [Entamoeba dispar SAW760]